MARLTKKQRDNLVSINTIVHTWKKVLDETKERPSFLESVRGVLETDIDYIIGFIDTMLYPEEE